MCDLLMTSRVELLEFLKESGTFGLAKNLRVTDQCEKQVWDMFQKTILKKPAYYVHADMSDDRIYLKLNQVVDIATLNGGKQSHSVLFIRDKTIKIKDTFQQISELLWQYIQSLGEMERTLFVCCRNGHFEDSQHIFQVFHERLLQFIKKEVKIVAIY